MKKDQTQETLSSCERKGCDTTVPFERATLCKWHWAEEQRKEQNPQTSGETSSNDSDSGERQRTAHEMIRSTAWGTAVSFIQTRHKAELEHFKAKVHEGAEFPDPPTLDDVHSAARYAEKYIRNQL